MDKTIIKTVCATLLSVLLCIILIFSVLVMFSPKTLGRFCDQFGTNKTGLWFYERQYVKTCSAEDLSVLCDRVDLKVETELAYGYNKKLVESQDFDEFCLLHGQIKGLTPEQIEEYNRDYYYANYTVCSYEMFGFSSPSGNGALDVADGFFLKYAKYSVNNPYRVIIAEYGNILTKSQLITLRDKIALCGSGETVTKDINFLNTLIDEKGE